MLRNNKSALSSAPVALATGWQRLLLGLGLLLVAAACSSTPGNIGVGLPSADANTGAYLVDTLTIRASTVLRDSIITSGSNLLLVGRYKDPQLGTITAKSYVTMSLPSNFTPSQTQVFDSLVLVLKPNTYRYGDTTKTQTLVDVHRLNSFAPTTQHGYASPKLTPMSGRVRAESVNDPNQVIVRRARRNIPTLRLRLASAFGQELLDAGKARLLTSQEQLDARFPGLALLPGATDEAALVQFAANSETAALTLYYHESADPATALNYAFALSTGRHFYQAEADRSAIAGLNTLTTSLQQIPAALTTQQTYIQGLLGLQTKIEIPYLTNLRSFGRNIIITSAVMTAQIPDNTSGARTNLFPPTELALYTANQNNRPLELVQSSNLVSGNTIKYNPAVANLAGINQAGYEWSVLTYCQGVINGQTTNTGLLLNTASPTTPERVVLGGPNRANNKLQLRLYLISNN
jgi:hypothetical protein